MPALLFGDPFGGSVESGVGVVAFAVTLRQNAATHMYRNVGANLFAFARFRKHHTSIDGMFKVLLDGYGESGLCVNAERFTNGNLFSGY